MTRTLFPSLVAGALLMGCSAHSPMIISNTADVDHEDPVAPAHRGGIYLTPDTFQSDFVRVVGKIDAGTIWYGDDDEALELIAGKARELGATAVMQVETWHQPSGFAWSAPHASGVAVVFTQPIPLDPRRGRVF